MALRNVDCFPRLNFYVRILNLKFGNFHLKKEEVSPVRTNSDSFKGKCELFCFFFVIFTEL